MFELVGEFELPGFYCIYKKYPSGLFVVSAGVLADSDPQIWNPRSKFASGFGPPGPNPLANMDPLRRFGLPM